MLDQKNRFRDWADTNSDLPLFYQPYWLDAILGSKNWSIALDFDQGGAIRGLLPYYLKRRWGLPVISHPALTPRMGPWLIYPKQMQQHRRYDFEEKVIHQLIDQLPTNLYTRIKCHPQLSNWYPFFKKGFRQTTAYTYQLDLSHSPSLWPNLEDKTRNKIRKAKQTISIQKEGPLKELFRLLTYSIRLKNQETLLTSIITTLEEREQGQIYFAQDQQGQYHAALYLAYDHHTAYNLLLGTDPNLRQSGAASYLLWQAILDAAKQVPRFDFEGSMLPGVERFFRGFGPDLVPYHVLEKWRF